MNRRQVSATFALLLFVAFYGHLNHPHVGGADAQTEHHAAHQAHEDSAPWASQHDHSPVSPLGGPETVAIHAHGDGTFIVRDCPLPPTTSPAIATFSFPTVAASASAEHRLSPTGTFRSSPPPLFLLHRVFLI